MIDNILGQESDCNCSDEDTAKLSSKPPRTFVVVLHQPSEVSEPSSDDEATQYLVTETLFKEQKDVF